MRLTRNHKVRLAQGRRDRGFSLIELLVVITILGVLAAAVVLAVSGYRDDAEDSACPAEWRQLNTSVEVYFVENDTTMIPDADGTAEGYENTMVASGNLLSTSKWYDLETTGNIVLAAGSPCTI